MWADLQSSSKLFTSSAQSALIQTRQCLVFTDSLKDTSLERNSIFKNLEAWRKGCYWPSVAIAKEIPIPSPLREGLFPWKILLYRLHPNPIKWKRHILNLAMRGQVPGRILIKLIPNRAVSATVFLLWGFQCTFCSFLLEILRNLQVFCSLFVSKLLLQNCLPERTLSSFTGTIFKFRQDSLSENVIPENRTSQGCCGVTWSWNNWPHSLRWRGHHRETV